MTDEGFCEAPALAKAGKEAIVGRMIETYLGPFINAVEAFRLF